MEPAPTRAATGSSSLHGLFEDLEQQAAGLELERRDAEVEDRVRDAYAEVELADRLHASLGAPVVMDVAGTDEQVRGTLVRVGADWVLVDAGAAEVVVPHAAVTAARGLADRVVPVAARPVTARLRLTSCLRRLAEDGERQLLRLADGRLRSGELGRVGRDFVELWEDRADGASPDPGATVVPLAALTWIRPA